MPASRLDAAVTLPGEEFSRVALTEATVDLLRKQWRRFLIRSALMDWPV